MKTWDETIQYIRNEPAYQHLVNVTYFSTDVIGNAERFRLSDEWKATVKALQPYVQLKNAHVLDVGAGGGISSYAFVKEGGVVDAMEPDNSETIGARAIEKLAEIVGTDKLKAHRLFAEDFVSAESYDIVYARQSMHHAANLQQFVLSAFKGLKKNGIFITVRDHVINDAKDKAAFLKRHPLQHFYGGENAFTLDEYRSAIIGAGFVIKDQFGPLDSDINLFPYTKPVFNKMVIRKIPLLGRLKLVQAIAWRYYGWHLKKLPGRIYSFIAIKP